VIQDALLVAVQAHADVVVTATVTLPPPTATFGDVGDTVNAHAAAACVTVTVVPAIVSVPVWLDVDVFAAAEYVTVPLPDPLAPVVTLSHDALLAAVQLQPLVVVTVTEFVPPLDVAL